MPDFMAVIPFGLVGVAMVIFGLVLNRRDTASARRIDKMDAERAARRLQSGAH
jgi:hypothetical protein